ncbi:MAG TPA: phosphoribosylglycinamide synthetase C domain-containing protein [Candidatus Binatia bacterium]|nr:phosphoribosylglycinamide synthetase C domain-containing protein [Candidatus Binatia bacterium]
MNGKRKFLFVSHIALVGDLAWQVKKEGHDVRYFIRDKAQKDVCDDVVEKVDDWEKHVDWADVVVFDDVAFGETADKLRKQGKAVIGGSAYTDKLEEDREFGQEEMKAVGMNVLAHWDFTDFDKAIDFLEDNPGRYVLKPSGKAQNEKELLFVGQEDDGKDVHDVLIHYKKNWSKKIKTFQLQKYAAGVEVAVGAFFNGIDFIAPINVNFEHKRMFPGEIGPSTGEMGTSMFWVPQNAIFRETLGRMKDRLAAAKYVGYIDINCIVNAKGVYPLEFTSRFGYPTISIQLEGITSKMGPFLYELARHQQYELKTKRGFQVGVVIACPPFPFDDPAAFRRYSEDATILFKRQVMDGVHIGDVKFVDDDWRLAGNSGYALIVTGSGITMEDARAQAYVRVKNIMIPNMFYRTDIGQRWRHEGDMLRTWGYLH